MGGEFCYVYMLRSVADPDRYYVGRTEDLPDRVKRHNAGHIPHTSKFIPWQVETAVAFRSEKKAIVFEKYLKSHSGRAFAKKHF
jgi:predicted GIY-YIG superfamily endonuclease